MPMVACEDARMTKIGITRGQWEAVTPCPGECCWHIQPVGNEDGSFGYINGPEMCEADAKLCAAAPDLLGISAAIVASRSRVPTQEEWDSLTRRAVRAVQKALERQP